MEFAAQMPLLANGAPDRAKVKEKYGGEQK
jgi:hypothetical protein